MYVDNNGYRLLESVVRKPVRSGMEIRCRSSNRPGPQLSCLDLTPREIRYTDFLIIISTYT